MSKARELIEAVLAFGGEPEIAETGEVNENASVTAHDSHYGEVRKIGHTVENKHNGSHVAKHTAYPDSISRPRDMGSFPTKKEAEDEVKRVHSHFENHPKYKHWYKKS